MKNTRNPKGATRALAQARDASERQSRLTRSPERPHDTRDARRKQPLPQHYPNLSPTRPPSDGSHVALWPWWTRHRVTVLNYDAFDDEGNLHGDPLSEGDPLAAERGC